jgi:hypothetical protein
MATQLFNEEGVWRELLQNKYLHTKSLAKLTVQPIDSPFWKGLMKVKEEFFSRGFVAGNGVDTRFWEYTWLENPLHINIFLFITLCNGNKSL